MTLLQPGKAKPTKPISQAASADTRSRTHVAYLADYPHLIPDVARLQFEEWGHLREDDSLERRIRRLEESTRGELLPVGFVALENGELRGSAMLVASDMDTRPELSPWLASVCVGRQHRRQGWGSALVERVSYEAWHLGFPRIFLYTHAAEQLYAKLGWVAEDTCDYLGEEVTVMSLANPEG